MSQESESRLEWRDLSASSGEVFRVGRDIVYREGTKRLRVMAMSTPDRAYRQAFLDAVSVIVEAWDTPVEIVLDFSISGPPVPGQAVGLCRDLHASGHVERIVILRHPNMPGWLLVGVSKILQSAGLPVEIEEVP